MRADAGFSLPEILGVCERCGVRYAIGFARNAVTERKIAPLFEQPAQEVYDRFYVQRGAESEHRIKELKLGIQADRLSCHSFVANQFRLLLSQAAYILLLSIRQAAAGTQFTSAQVERLRALLIKGAARVRVSVRQVLVELSAYCPYAADLRLIAERLQTAAQLQLN